MSVRAAVMTAPGASNMSRRDDLSDCADPSARFLVTHSVGRTQPGVRFALYGPAQEAGLRVEVTPRHDPRAVEDQ